jgi:hypothetical protein
MVAFDVAPCRVIYSLKSKHETVGPVLLGGDVRVANLAARCVETTPVPFHNRLSVRRPSRSLRKERRPAWPQCPIGNSSLAPKG